MPIKRARAVNGDTYVSHTVPKRTVETKKEELNPYANDVKTAMIQSHQMTIPIERVIYVNDSVNVIHKSGTNRYYVNFPETWRTTNQKHVIGIRSIQLRHGYGRVFEFSMNFSYYDDSFFSSEIKKIDVKEIFRFKYTYGDNVNPNPIEWVNELNKKWNEYIKYFKNIDSYTWQCNYDESTKLYVLELVAVDGETCVASVKNNTITYKLLNVSPDLYNVDVKFETNRYETSKSNAFPVSETPKIIIPGPLESYDEYLVSASFVEQTEHGYLGFTNSVFSPPKYYQLTSTDTKFWIDLVSPDGLKPRELPVDGRDLLIIEIQLLTQPNLNKF